MRGFVAFLGALAFCTCAVAQGGGWAAVQGLPPESRVEVRLSPPKTVKGMLLTVSGSGMDLQKPDGSVLHIARARVARVYLAGKSHKLRDGLIGAGVGGAGGMVVGLTTFGGNPDYFAGPFPRPHSVRTEAAVVFGAVLGAAGAVIGAAFGSHHRKTLGYRRETGPNHGDRKAVGRSSTSGADAAYRSPAAGAGAGLR